MTKQELDRLSRLEAAVGDLTAQVAVLTERIDALLNLRKENGTLEKERIGRVVEMHEQCRAEVLERIEKLESRQSGFLVFESKSKAILAFITSSIAFLAALSGIVIGIVKLVI